MKNIGYYNGKTGPIEEMTIPMTDRVVFFGDGVYDATYAAGGVVFAMEDHLSRFYRSLAKLKIPAPMPERALAATIQSCVDQVDAPGSLMIYFQATRGSGMRSHVFPPAGTPSNLYILAWPVPMRRSDRVYRLVTAEDTRFYHCDIKTLNLIPNVMASQQAAEAGCDEAVFHRGETVTECAHSNISILKGGVFRTAPLSNLILPGTARRHLLALAAQNGIPTAEKAFTLGEMFAADEVIVHSSGSLCNAACEIDGRKVGGRDPALLKRLQDAAVGQFESYTGVRFADYAE